MKSKTVLLVDDEPHVTHVMALKMRASGLAVLTAPDGEEALRLISLSPPDLVVTDYQMPVLTGFDLALQLKKCAATAHLPVLMITARGHMLPPEDIARTNIRDVICKPFSPRLVLERVLALLGEGLAADEQTRAAAA